MINRRQNMGQIDARGVANGSHSRRRSSRRGSRTRGTSTPGTWRRFRVRSYTIGVGDFAVDQGNKKFASGRRTTGRSGSPDAEPRCAHERGTDLANDISFPPFQEAGRPNDWNNVQPRLGFANG